MFQYALYLQLKETGKDVRIDTSMFDFNNSLREYELARVFGISTEPVDPKKASDIRGYGPRDGIIDKIRHRLVKSDIKKFEDPIDRYCEEIADLDNVLLAGYWQNLRYFSKAGDKVRQTYTFTGISGETQKVADKMRSEQSVFIHIRRSDYLSDQNARIYGNICTPEYYEKAISLIKSKVNNPIFYVFCDDENWAKENVNEIHESNMTFVDINRNDRSYLDMYLMTQCKHGIIANSSFSWWGAWLGVNKDRTIICPGRWFNNHETTDMLCEGWFRL